MTVIGERMLDLRQVRRVFDTKPWAAHLYVTEQCNLDCHYCNEFNNSIPHPALADLKEWMDHIRKLDVMRLEVGRSEEHTSELQSPVHLVCRLLLEKKKK